MTEDNIVGAEMWPGSFVRTALYTNPMDWAAAVDQWISVNEEQRRHVVAWLRAVAAEVE